MNSHAAFVRPRTEGALSFGLSATVLAFMNPVLLQQIGSSFSDITTTGLVLGGWLLFVQAVRPRTTRIVVGAIVLGFATALKPTNSIYAVAGFILVAFVPLPILGRIRALFYFGAVLGISFVVTAAPWSYRLAKCLETQCFRCSTIYSNLPTLRTSSSKAYRFIPDSLTEALLRPFAMSGTGGMIHEELSSPDIVTPCCSWYLCYSLSLGLGSPSDALRFPPRFRTLIQQPAPSPRLDVVSPPLGSCG